jgi:hypothetical protein
MEIKKTDQSMSGIQVSTKQTSRIDLAHLTPNIISRKIRGLNNNEIHELTFTGEFKTLATIRKGTSIDGVQAVIEGYLIELDEVMNLSRRLNESMVRVIAEDVYDAAYVLSFEELSRFFKELRTGRHGSMYQGLNSESICRALGSFIQSRSSYFQQKSENESNSWKVRRERSEDEAANLTVDEMKERFTARFSEEKK